MDDILQHEDKLKDYYSRMIQDKIKKQDYKSLKQLQFMIIDDIKKFIVNIMRQAETTITLEELKGLKKLEERLKQHVFVETKHTKDPTHIKSIFKNIQHT